MSASTPSVQEVKKTTCYMCACRCGIRVHLVDGQVRYIDGNPEHPLNQGVICAKGSSGIMKQYSPARLTRPLPAVQRVAYHRVPAVGSVDPYLVRPPALQAGSQQGDRTESLDDVQVGDGVSPLPSRDDGHLLSLAGVPANGRLHTGALPSRGPPDQGEVSPAKNPCRQLFRKRQVRLGVLRYDEEAGRVLVETVNDAGAQASALIA